MMVMEKTRDIAVLMSMGSRKSQIRSLFIAQGLLIGVFGTSLGLVLGYTLSWVGGHYHPVSYTHLDVYKRQHLCHQRPG